MFATKVSSSSLAVRFPGAATATRLSIYYHKTQTRKYSIPVPNKKKVWESAEEAVKGDAVKSGDTLLCGGVFFLFL
jgi:3-oxoacid CoA-transferase